MKSHYSMQTDLEHPTKTPKTSGVLTSEHRRTLISQIKTTNRFEGTPILEPFRKRKITAEIVGSYIFNKRSPYKSESRNLQLLGPYFFAVITLWLLSTEQDGGTKEMADSVCKMKIWKTLGI